MILFVFIVFFLYSILIIAFSIGFRKIKIFKQSNDIPKTTFSVVIPFRNEAHNLPSLLRAIEKLRYPQKKVEYLLVDDASEDASIKIIKAFLNKKHGLAISLLENKRISNSPKKDAILTAISVAKNDWIVTTDADCILSEKWLTVLSDFIQQKSPKMVVSPVNYLVDNVFLEQFQLLDFISLQGVTVGGFGIGIPLMCNGANLAYKKEDFIRYNGFVGNNTMASGDDVFLFEKFLAEDKKSVQFLKSKEVIVTTFPVHSWRKLLHQRMRWAAKTGNLKSIPIKIIGFLVLLLNLLIVGSFLGMLFGINSYQIPFVLWICKSLVDLTLLIPSIQFYNHSKTFFNSYFFSSLLYPFFSVFIVFSSFFFKYNWKGRRFKK